MFPNVRPIFCHILVFIYAKKKKFLRSETKYYKIGLDRTKNEIVFYLVEKIDDQVFMASRFTAKVIKIMRILGN